MNGTLTVEDASSNPATLNVTGNYTQSNTGLLNIKLNGTTSGTTYDTSTSPVMSPWPER